MAQLNAGRKGNTVSIPNWSRHLSLEIETQAVSVFTARRPNRRNPNSGAVLLSHHLAIVSKPNASWFDLRFGHRKDHSEPRLEYFAQGVFGNLRHKCLSATLGQQSIQPDYRLAVMQVILTLSQQASCAGLMK